MMVILMLNPILIAVGNLAMRSSKKLPDEIVSGWMNFTLTFVSITIVFISGNDLAIWR
jgi:hypothetical protein